MTLHTDRDGHTWPQAVTQTDADTFAALAAQWRVEAALRARLLGCTGTGERLRGRLLLGRAGIR